MKQSAFELAVAKYVELQTKVFQRFEEDFIKPLEDIGSPEKLVGRKYEEWTSEDRKRLIAIYGTDKNPLTDLIFKKDYEGLLAEEAQV